MSHMMICSSDLPDGCWLGDLTRAHPGIRARVISIYYKLDEDGGQSISRVIIIPPREGIVEMIESHEAVDYVDIEEERPLILTVRHSCPLADVFAATTHPSPPFTVSGGRVEWDLIKEDNGLRVLLKDRGLRITVRRSRRRGRGLTPRQREILLRAIDEGYYDFPRRITLSELAERMGISKSYLSETLTKIESKLLPELLILHS